jgi:hypothetical protein
MSPRSNAFTPRPIPALVPVPIATRTPDADGPEAVSASTPLEYGEPRVRPTLLELAILLGTAAWVVLLLLVRWPALWYPQFNSNSNIDSAFFTFAGQVVRDGGTPYLAFWDHKPPLIYLIDALALTVSGGAIWGVWLATVAALLATLGMGFTAWRRVFGVAAATIAAVWLAFALDVVSPFNLTEGFALPAQAAALLILARWSRTPGRVFLPALGVGALGGLTFMLRPNLIGAPAAVAITMVLALLITRRMRDLPALFGGALLGAAIIIGPILAWLGGAGALGAFRDQVFHYNFVYSAATLRSRIRAAFEGMALTTMYGSLILPLGGWLFAAYRLRSTRRDATLLPVLILCLVWMPLELAFAAVPGRTYGHYFTPLLLSLASLVALCVTELFALIDRAFPAEVSQRWRQTAAVVLCAALAIVPVGHVVFDVRDSGLRSDRARQVQLTAQYIRTHTAPDAPLLVWGHASDVYMFANRKPASRFVYSLALFTPGYADSALVNGFLDELRTSAPPIIVDATPNLPRAEALAPSLASWNPNWRYPASGVAWWTMTPAMQSVYDYMRANYVASGAVGPYRWVVYQRVANVGLR